MITDFAQQALLVIMAISALSAVFSPLFFSEGGLIWGTVTRKGIVVAFVGFEIFLLSGCMAMWIHDPSQYLTPLMCGGGGTISLGIYFLFMYLRYPHNKEKRLKLQKKTEELLRRIHEEQENQQKNKDGDNE